MWHHGGDVYPMARHLRIPSHCSQFRQIFARSNGVHFRSVDIPQQSSITVNSHPAPHRDKLNLKTSMGNKRKRLIGIVVLYIQPAECGHGKQ
jgi:hypothetical protein